MSIFQSSKYRFPPTRWYEMFYETSKQLLCTKPYINKTNNIYSINNTNLADVIFKMFLTLEVKIVFDF